MPPINAYALSVSLQPSTIEDGRVEGLNGRTYRRLDPGSSIGWLRNILCLAACSSGAMLALGAVSLALSPEDDCLECRESGIVCVLLGATLTPVFVYFFHRSGQDSYYTSDLNR